MHKQFNKGFSSIGIVLILLAVAFGGYTVYYYTSNNSVDDGTSDEMGLPMANPDHSPDMNGEMVVEEGDDSADPDNVSDLPIDYSGEVLAGDEAKFLNFVKTDYEQAIKTDKLVVLYFYANWCPLCKAELPKLYDAFNSLDTNRVVGFRVNFNDNETDRDEEGLAREFGVAYQHTKVFVKNGQRVGKWPDSWNKDRYLEEINNAL